MKAGRKLNRASGRDACSHGAKSTNNIDRDSNVGATSRLRDNVPASNGAKKGCWRGMPKGGMYESDMLHLRSC